MAGLVRHLNPEGLHHNPAFTQAVVVEAGARMVFVGGQNAVAADGTIVGKGDLKAQSRQAYANLQTALAAAGATLQDVIKWNIYVVQGQEFRPGFEVFQEVWGEKPNPPTITGVMVVSLAHPDFLVEIEAVAVIGAAGGRGDGK